MKNILIVGSGGHAKCVIDILHAMEGYSILGCVADDSDPGRSVLGVPIVGTLSALNQFSARDYKVAIGVGGWKDINERKRLFNQVISLGFDVISPIHPAARIAPSAQIGMGATVFSGVDIGPDVHIGKNVMVGTASFISHETVVEEHTLISAGVNLGGNVAVGASCLIAIGATVASRVRIGDGTLVAAGAVVVGDTPPFSRVMGVPAKVCYGALNSRNSRNT